MRGLLADRREADFTANSYGHTQFFHSAAQREYPVTDHAIFFRLRPGVRHPSFRAGELYRFIEPTHPEGYIYLELDGRRRCVWLQDFEQVDEPRNGSAGP